MSLSLLKVLTIGGVCCGIVVPPTFVFAGGSHVIKGFLVAKSKNNDVQLYLKATKFEEKDGVKIAKEYGLEAEYKGKKVSGNWMLCSPSANKNRYFLLKSNSSWSWEDVKGHGKLCNYARENDVFGEELSVEFLEESAIARNVAPKTIFLTGCKIEELNKTANQIATGEEKRRPKFSLTCSTKEQESVNSNNQIKLVDRGLF